MAAVRAIDVADYILGIRGPISAMKLQKLVYYCQAWCLVWTEHPMFKEAIKAWTNGPVVRELYDAHKGHYLLTPGFFGGRPQDLSEEQRDVVALVLEFYGGKDPQWLSELTHMEAPWREARQGLVDTERGNRTISEESILEYYSSL